MVAALVGNGADVDLTKTKKNTTPLYISSYNGHTSIVNHLLENGADASICCSDSAGGLTPLCAACEGLFKHAGAINILDCQFSLSCSAHHLQSCWR